MIASWISLFIDKFESDWKAAMGWMCTFALAWDYLGEPLFYDLWCVFTVHPLPLPQINSADLMPLVLSLLGMGALKTYENTRS